MNERYREIMEKVYADKLRKGADGVISHLLKRCEGNEEGLPRLVEAVDLMLVDLESGKIVDIYLGRIKEKSAQTYPVTVRKDYRTLGEALKDFREQMRISQQKLSDLAGISSRTTFKVEAEYQDSIRIDVREKLFAILDIQPSEKRDYVWNLPVRRQNDKPE